MRSPGNGSHRVPVSSARHAARAMEWGPRQAAPVPSPCRARRDRTRNGTVRDHHPERHPGQASIRAGYHFLPGIDEFLTSPGPEASAGTPILAVLHDLCSRPTGPAMIMNRSTPAWNRAQERVQTPISTGLRRKRSATDTLMHIGAVACQDGARGRSSASNSAVATVSTARSASGSALRTVVCGVGGAAFSADPSARNSAMVGHPARAAK